MSDGDRFVPTPEELEEGKLKKQQRDGISESGETEEPQRFLRRLGRRLGVGRRRTYEEAESKTVEPQTKPPEPKGEPSTTHEPQGTRVRSVRVPRRETKKVTPVYAPNSPQAMFLGKTAAKGHRMGQLQRVPNSTNWTASCDACGMEGELVIQHDENYANQTYEIARGPAVERSCPSRGPET